MKIDFGNNYYTILNEVIKYIHKNKKIDLFLKNQKFTKIPKNSDKI